MKITLMWWLTFFQDLADPVSVAALCISSKRRDEIFIPFFLYLCPFLGGK